MSCAVVLAAVAFAFIAYRRPFHVLPLHIDTAFYVPNRVVAGGGLGLFSGWNAHFSAGSRLLPQLVHSVVYLIAGPKRYASAFRWLYAVVVFATAGTTALLFESLATTFPAGRLAAFSALIAYLLLASETQYAAYFESAEVFQVLFQATGVLLCVTGLTEDRSGLVLLGVAALWFDAVLIKLTGVVSACLVSAAIAWHRPALSPWLVLLGVLAGLALLAIIRASGGGVVERLRFLGRHERFVRRNYPSSARLAFVKVLFMGRLVLRNPVIPLVAAAAIVVRPDGRLPGPVLAVLAAWGVAIVLAFLRQGHRVWYYAIPFFPVVALLFASTVLAVAERTTATAAAVVLCAACGLSLSANLVPRLLLDPEAFTRWLFSLYNRPGGRFGDAMAAGNLAVARAAPKLRQRVQGRPMLVLGAFNQASVLTGAAYDTPLASVCALAEGTSGNLERYLPGIENVPPDFVLDTDGAFEALRNRWAWLSRYRLVATSEQLRLFERVCRLDPGGPGRSPAPG